MIDYYLEDERIISKSEDAIDGFISEFSKVVIHLTKTEQNIIRISLLKQDFLVKHLFIAFIEIYESKKEFVYSNILDQARTNLLMEV